MKNSENMDELESTGELEMSESEICLRFRRNGCDPKMIRILAELNAVDDEVIADILWENDLLKQKPKKMRRYRYGT